jgi:hypothetical protein
MTAFNSPKPIEPRPDDFSLTEERARRFRAPFDVTEPWLILTVVLLGFFGGGLIGVYAYQSKNSILFAVVSGFFGFVICSIGIGVVLAVTNSVVDEAWRRCQPDYDKFRSFKTALEGYETGLRQWRRQQTAWWESLSGGGFEAEIARLFERRGYATRRLGGAGDEGIDLILRKDGKEILVQCKAHGRPVGPGAVRDLYGAMMHKRAAEGWLISTMGFSQAAKKFATGKPLRLISVEEILRGTS